MSKVSKNVEKFLKDGEEVVSNLKGNSYEIVNIIKNDSKLKKISIKSKIKFRKNRKDLY